MVYMTLLYTLLGLPQTFDEFVDKMKKENKSEADVVVACYNRKLEYHCSVAVKAGRIKIKLGDHVHARQGDLYDTVIRKSEVEQAAAKDALEYAEKLKEQGFDVTVNGQTLDFIKKVLSGYDESILGLKRKFYGDS